MGRRSGSEARVTSRPAGRLPDGSEVFGQVGVLELDEFAGKVRCAACGRWFQQLGGSHLLNAHGLDADGYREKYGLMVNRPLEGLRRRAERSRTMHDRIAREPLLRAMLDRGAEEGRSGALFDQSRGQVASTARRNALRPEGRRVLVERGQRGAERSGQIGRQRTELQAQALGFDCLADYLSARHAAGKPMTVLSQELQVARETVRGLLAEHGLVTGADPAAPVERAALARVGHPSLRSYLAAQHAAGATTVATAAGLGHSVPWLQIRADRDGLEHLLTRPLTALERATQAATAAGFDTLTGYLRHRCQTDAVTSRSLQKEFGMQGQMLAGLLRDAGVHRQTAQDRERLTLQAVGYHDLQTYVLDRTAAGATVEAMSIELGRSDGWLARRMRATGLGHLIGPPGRRPPALTLAADTPALAVGHVR